MPFPFFDMDWSFQLQQRAQSRKLKRWVCSLIQGYVVGALFHKCKVKTLDRCWIQGRFFVPDAAIEFTECGTLVDPGLRAPIADTQSQISSKPSVWSLLDPWSCQSGGI